MSKQNDNFEFKKIGDAIKKAREAKEIKRDDFAETLDIAPRHLQAVENEGQYPSIPLFFRMVRLLDISIDEYMFPDKPVTKTTIRRQLDTLLDAFDDKELSIVNATAKAICKAKEPEE